MLPLLQFTKVKLLPISATYLKYLRRQIEHCSPVLVNGYFTIVHVLSFKYSTLRIQYYILTVSFYKKTKRDQFGRLVQWWLASACTSISRFFCNLRSILSGIPCWSLSIFSFEWLLNGSYCRHNSFRLSEFSCTL